MHRLGVLKVSILLLSDRAGMADLRSTLISQHLLLNERYIVRVGHCRLPILLEGFRGAVQHLRLVNFACQGAHEWKLILLQSDTVQAFQHPADAQEIMRVVRQVVQTVLRGVWLALHPQLLTRREQTESEEVQHELETGHKPPLDSVVRSHGFRFGIRQLIRRAVIVARLRAGKQPLYVVVRLFQTFVRTEPGLVERVDQ